MEHPVLNADSLKPQEDLTMLRTTVAFGATIVAMTLAGSAHAEQGEGSARFGARGVIVSADRLIPLTSFESVKTTQTDGSSFTRSHVSLGLLSNGPFTAFETFYNLPRLAFDWVPIRSLTLGGAVWLYTQLSASDSLSPPGGPSVSTDQPKVTYWGVAPRIGYVIPLSETISLWPRAGVEYHDVSSSSVNGREGPSVTQWSVELEAMLVIFPWKHFGFTVGATADIPITGKTTSQSQTGTGVAGVATTKVDSAMLQIGASAGMLGHF